VVTSTTKTISRLEVEHGGDLLAGDVRAWIDQVPPEATVTASMGERGSQRDPEPFLRALVATW
jgi:hypothetical protein